MAGGTGSCWRRQTELSHCANVMHSTDSQPQVHPSVLCSVMLSRRSETPFLRFPPQRTSSVLPVRGSGRELEGQQRGKRPSSRPSFYRHLCVYSGRYTASLLAAHAPAMGHHTPSLNGVQASFRGPSMNCVSPSVV